MAEQIRAEISKILEFNAALNRTIAQIDSVISDYEIQIQGTKEKLAEISAASLPAERIYSDFLCEVSAYKKEMESLRQDYINLIRKSSYILTQYAELLGRSAAVTAQLPATGTGAATGTGTAAGTGAVIGTGAAPGGHPDGGAANQRTEGAVLGAESRGHMYELPATKQTWITNPDGSRVFNTPEETGRKLDSRQGKENGYLGTCGLVSCVNILRLAGYPATEGEVVRYASSTPAGFGTGKLCTTNSFPENNGGTSAKGRQQILRHFGIQSELKDATIRNLSDAVCEGRGVIISVYAGMLHYGWSNYRDLHAVTVTSVKKDRHGNVLGFYVCDSGTGGTDSSRYYTVAQIENALSGRQMNVTSIIR